MFIIYIISRNSCNLKHTLDLDLQKSPPVNILIIIIQNLHTMITVGSIQFIIINICVEMSVNERNQVNATPDRLPHKFK